jgi:biotin carboxyl carrier protein
MKGYRITLGGQTFEVEILSDPRGKEVQVRVDGETLMVNVAPLPAAPAPVSAATPPQFAPKPPRSAPGPSSQREMVASAKTLTAPLPGTVIQVAVQPGQSVGRGDELLVIEAMKMNNRIRSPRNGTVGDVLVQVGEQVSHGAPLLSWAD